MHTQKLPGQGKKVLFATVPADGHFNPLTGLAKHLQSLGFDVRWYTSVHYADKLRKLGIPHFPFIKAKDFATNQVEELLTERPKIKSKIEKLNFDFIHLFIKRGPEYFEDIQDIHAHFPFQLLVADVTFTAIPLVKTQLKVPVFSIGIIPLPQTSKDLPPTGLGLEPDYSFKGKLRNAGLRFLAHKILFRKADRLARRIMNDHQVDHGNHFFFDLGIHQATYYLQSGVPGFEYQRTDLSPNVRFIGSLLPYRSSKASNQWFDERLNQYEQVVLVTQGTVEKDVSKIIMPTLEAFKDSDTLVIATTGGSGTEQLQAAYPQKNIIIADFIPFEDVLPYTDVYITNGGYGGVMLGIENRVPMVVAGVHEGKNEICARVGYFKIGINLKTETPSVPQLKQAVNTVMHNKKYKNNIEWLADEFSGYKANDLFAGYVASALGMKDLQKQVVAAVEPTIY
jgi:MGT family glycosyltransferase